MAARRTHRGLPASAINAAAHPGLEASRSSDLSTHHLTQNGSTQKRFVHATDISIFPELKCVRVPRTPWPSLVFGFQRTGQSHPKAHREHGVLVLASIIEYGYTITMSRIIVEKNGSFRRVARGEGRGARRKGRVMQAQGGRAGRAWVGARRSPWLRLPPETVAPRGRASRVAGLWHRFSPIKASQREKMGVAVGTALSSRPPHGSGRAELPHPVLAAGST